MEASFENPVRMPLPCRYGKQWLTRAMVDSPTNAALGEVEKSGKRGIYAQIKAFLDGSVIAYLNSKGDTIDDPAEIKKINNKIARESAIALVMAAVLASNDDDMVEGIYTCPRCGEEQVAELDGDGNDTRDHISALTVVCKDALDDRVKIDLVSPIIIKGKSLVSEESLEMAINSFSLHYPTIEDCINARGKYGAEGEIGQQFAYYVEALEEINGDPVSKKEKAEIGMKMFQSMRKAEDVKRLNREMNRYSVDQTVEKRCLECNKKWRAGLNTSSFFASALQSG